jgi:hypothetical protein
VAGGFCNVGTRDCQYGRQQFVLTAVRESLLIAKNHFALADKLIVQP